MYIDEVTKRRSIIIVSVIITLSVFWFICSSIYTERGYATGYVAGSEDGFDEGYTVGFDERAESARNEGFSEGYREGYSLGYTDGCIAAKADGC